MTRRAALPAAAVASAPRPPEVERRGVAPRSRWSWQRIKRFALPALALAVLALLAAHARDIDWAGAGQALRAYRLPTLLGAALLTAASFVLYGCFDLLGRAYTGHHLPALRVWATAFVAYAFNLNLGSMIGSVGLRLRLYSRMGLRVGVIGRIIGLSLVTNWLGHAAAGGVVLAAGALTLPAGWPLHGIGLRLFGVALLGVVGAYVAACRWSKRRAWTLRGQALVLPNARTALTQLVISMANWSLIGAVIYVLLHGAVAFATVLGVLLLAGIAGVATHVPAGLGVLEAVFLSLLSGRVPQGTLLGALLAYRALYYLAPLVVAVAVYFTLEALARRASAPAKTRP
jgi:uncharacterized membrane protein YbhN (UPF0104 family)